MLLKYLIILFQEIIKESTPLNSKTLTFIPRQLSVTNSITKIKKPNRVIFHRQTNT